MTGLDLEFLGVAMVSRFGLGIEGHFHAARSCMRCMRRCMYLQIPLEWMYISTGYRVHWYFTCFAYPSCLGRWIMMSFVVSAM